MKTNQKNRNLTVVKKQPLYPNAADASYFAGKAINVLTALVSGMGFISAMVLVVAMV